MIVSFSWTAPALYALGNLRKSVTRRDWKPEHAEKFRAGAIHDAWAKSPRVGGKRIGRIKIAQKPYKENTHLAQVADWTAEGFEYLCSLSEEMREKAVAVWSEWHTDPRDLYVLRFEVVQLLCILGGCRAPAVGLFGGDNPGGRCQDHAPADPDKVNRVTLGIWIPYSAAEARVVA